MVDKNGIYAFDECSLLKLCKVQIPRSYVPFVGKQVLLPRNHNAVNELFEELGRNNVDRYKFIPHNNFEKHAFDVVNELLKGVPNAMMITVLRTQIIDQIQEFMSSANENFKNIEKKDEFIDVKSFFISNERNLTKDLNIPEDDDCKIIAGYVEFQTKGIRHLISEDEHFWGYKDLIEKEFGITVTEEWNCKRLC